jgi:hypothetical protein
LFDTSEVPRNSSSIVLLDSREVFRGSFTASERRGAQRSRRQEPEVVALGQQLTAIDDDGRAGDVAGSVGGEEQERVEPSSPTRFLQ